MSMVVVGRSVSISPVWSVSISISVPGIWISFSFGFSFSFLNNMDGSTTVSVVGVWFYDGVGNWGIVVSVWVIIHTTIDIWVGVNDWFLDFFGLSFNNFFFYLFGSLYCGNGILVVWVSVSVSVWMVDCCSSVGIVIPRICLGFGLSCGSSEESENYEKFHG